MYVNKDTTKDFVSVPWKRNVTLEEFFPSPSNDCGQGSCSLESDNTCLCKNTLSENVTFSDSQLPTQMELLRKCHIGAFDPAIIYRGYTLLANNDLSVKGRVEAWGLETKGLPSTSTIFKVYDENGEIAYLKNAGVISTENLRLGMMR